MAVQKAGKSKKKRSQRWISFLLAAAMVTTFFGVGQITVSASEPQWSFAIGVNEGSVTAELSEEGKLTISGAGEIKDFTPETAPFEAIREQITSVEIQGGVVSIGDCLFYNCGNIGGVLELPSGLVRIGSKAFSGDSRELAAKPDLVINRFQEAVVTVLKEEGSSEESSALESGESETSVLSEASGEEGAGSEPESGGQESAVDPSASSEPEHKYELQTLTQQQIGEEIFFPRETGSAAAFFCEESNLSFQSAMESAGFSKAQRLTQISFENGETVLQKTMAVVDGKVALPKALPEFTAPEGDELSSYEFAGWTEAQDPPYAAWAPGTAYEAGDREDLYFLSYWKRLPKKELIVKRESGKIQLSLPEFEGWAFVSVTWQQATFSSEQELPINSNALSWETLSGEKGKSFQTLLPKTGEELVFRSTATFQKGEEQLSLTFSPVTGIERKASAALTAQRTVSGQAAITGGKQFGSFEANEAAIPCKGALSARFFAADQEENLGLRLTSTEGAAVNIPAGAKVLLADRTNKEAIRYYTCAVSGESNFLPLTSLHSVDGAEAFPAKIQGSKELLAVFDFSYSSGGLPAGSYKLALCTQEASTVTQKAAFTAAEAGSPGVGLTVSYADSVLSAEVNITLPGGDPNYARGGRLRLFLKDTGGQKLPFPKETVISEEAFRNGDGSLSFAALSEGTKTLTFDLSGATAEELPDGEYTLWAELRPEPSLQLGASSSSEKASGAWTFARSGSETPRAILPTVVDGSSRILDVSEGPGEIKFRVSFKKGEADVLSAVLYEKTGKTPYDDSYQEFGSGVEWIAVGYEGPDQALVTVTIPQGTKSGTYQVRFSIQSAQGEVFRKESLDFILK